MKKKGFTLIELLISISFISIITFLEITMLSRYMKTYREQMKETKEYFYVNEAFMFIEYSIGNSESVEVDSNSIKLNYKDKSNWIKRKENKIVIAYDSKLSSRTNNIMLGVEDFTVNKNNNVIFVSIKIMKGKSYNKCFGVVKRIQEKEQYLYTH